MIQIGSMSEVDDWRQSEMRVVLLGTFSVSFSVYSFNSHHVLMGRSKYSPHLIDGA